MLIKYVLVYMYIVLNNYIIIFSIVVCMDIFFSLVFNLNFFNFVLVDIGGDEGI